MSKMKMYITDSLYLNAEQVSDNRYIIHLTNGKEIKITELPKDDKGSIWRWKIESQYFDKDEYALNYLKTLISEKLTGYRIVLHAKKEVPVICGVDGRACRSPRKCNTALCYDCPVAEAFHAERDGVKLIYAV